MEKKGKLNRNSLEMQPSGFCIKRSEVLGDYRIAYLSRQLSVIGRKEVHSGRAKFGIFGDGKEVAQVVYAKFFRNGDWRSGYYRDQTFMLAAGLLTPTEFFAQLYGNINEKENPSTAGRNFNNHFATANIYRNYSFRNLTQQKNSASDISPTAGQMPRLLGLAYASKLFRTIPEWGNYPTLSNNGNEVAFGMIGEASTSEGLFFETINAACVLQVPMAVAVWDNGFGISVPVDLQTTKGNIEKALEGFRKENGTNGCLLYSANGWDYPDLIEKIGEGISICRNKHIPVIFHITEMTQPTGHSSSGSHERYKSNDRLQFEKDFDPLVQMRKWMLNKSIASEEKITEIEIDVVNEVKIARQKAWDIYFEPYKNEKEELVQFIDRFPIAINGLSKKIYSDSSLQKNPYPSHSEILSFSKKLFYEIVKSKVEKEDSIQKFSNWVKSIEKKYVQQYDKYQYSEDFLDEKVICNVKPLFNSEITYQTGREIINKTFDSILKKYPTVVTFGEDTGKLGDVNGGLKGLQEKYGELRVTDTGIREATIIGQGTGLALRGMRPIAEIQYLDYLVYALMTLTDDLASLHYRTNGIQIAPLIIRTRGHRLVGMWHSGSPLGMMLGSLRGIYICTPRNMTQAAGFYNTLLELNTPAIVIEPLKSYDRHEPAFENFDEIRTPLGIPEIITSGTDITIVTYGWCVTEAFEAVERLREFDISVELIDVQSLLPFDTNHIIKASISKTHQVLFLDEDVPSGGTAYMMQKVLEEQQAFYLLDSQPRTLAASEHRPAYDTDGDYFSKPTSDTIFETVYEMMHDYCPEKYPL